MYRNEELKKFDSEGICFISGPASRPPTAHTEPKTELPLATALERKRFVPGTVTAARDTAEAVADVARNTYEAMSVLSDTWKSHSY